MIDIFPGRPLRLSPAAVAQCLAGLSPEIPWTHYFSLGDGAGTIPCEPSDKYFQKAKGLSHLATLLPGLVGEVRQNLGGLRILDLGCGEGLHGLFLASLGAEVMAVEGRDLYVRRARFIAEHYGLERYRVVQGDCRDLDTSRLGKFDAVLCLGLLHHLGRRDFIRFLGNLRALTNERLVIYAHVADEETIPRFRLTGPRYTIGRTRSGWRGYRGFAFQEHAPDASQTDVIAKVRASIGNVESFWPTHPSLLRALRDAGFGRIEEMDGQNHPFKDPRRRASRPLLLARP